MKLLTRLCMAVLVLGTVVAVVDNGSTSAQFTDRVNSAGTGLTASTLPAPVNVAAVLVGGATASAQVTWDAGAGDFATGWEIFRNVGLCSGWTPSGLPFATLGTATPRSYSDSTIVAGNTYCYAVRGTYLTWTSPFGTITAAAEVTYDETTLFPNVSGSNHQLIPSTGTGDETFGCLLLNALGLLCIGGDAPDSYVLQSTNQYTVYSSAGWTGSVRVTREGLLSLGTQQLDITLWYENGACVGPAPSDGRRIGTDSIVVGSLLGIGTTTAVAPLDFIPHGAFAAPGAPRTICMSIAANPSLAGLLVTLDVNNGAETWIEGSFQ